MSVSGLYDEDSDLYREDSNLYQLPGQPPDQAHDYVPRCETPHETYQVFPTQLPACTPAPVGRVEERTPVDVVPPAPRKKPPSSGFNLQGTSASASRCRERLAAASRPERWQVGTSSSGAGGAADEPIPMDENTPIRVLNAPALERSETGPRKRLDESLDEADLETAYLITPKKMRAAEEMLTKLTL